MSRRESISALSSNVFDLLIIGGGINGAGIARDASLRGLRVALLEQADFASGTSSRSSRLVHGGVRYLEHGELKLVFESSRERRTLLRIAPHLVRPLAFLWPVYRGARVNRVMLAAALTAYDALALFRNVARHKRLGARAALEIEPRLLGASEQEGDGTVVHGTEDVRALRSAQGDNAVVNGTAEVRALRSAQGDKLLGAAQYYDAATDDSRLTLANIIAAQRAGAVVLNHARVESLLRDGERVVGAVAHDGEHNTRFEVRASVVVNAAGPWSDSVAGMVRPGAKAGIHGSKGVHVNVPRERIGNRAALTLLAPQDGRVMFVLPAGAFTIIGTTDTFDDVTPGDVHATRADVAYLLEAANHYFPQARLTEADVISAWAGVRPLAATSEARGSAGSVSREHAIAETAPGFVRVTGGKLTTYRSMSAEVVNVVQKVLDVPMVHSQTAYLALPGGEIANVGAEIAAVSAVTDADVAERLVHAYGSEWRNVWAHAESEPALAARIEPDRPYLLAELKHAVDAEMACTLGDLLIRRMPLAFETRDHGRDAARRVSPMVARWLGWDAAREARALAEYDVELERMFTIR